MVGSLPAPQREPYLAPGGINLYTPNGFGMGFNYLQQSQLAQGQRQYSDALAATTQAQQALEQQDLQRKQMADAAGLISDLKTRDPSSAVMSQSLLRTMLPDTFPQLGEGMQGLFAQEAQGMAAGPQAEVFKNTGAGAHDFAQAGLVFPQAPTSNELLGGDLSPIFGVTPGAALSAASGGSGGAGGNKDTLNALIPGPNGTLVNAKVIGPGGWDRLQGLMGTIGGEPAVGGLDPQDGPPSVQHMTNSEPDNPAVDQAVDRLLMQEVGSEEFGRVADPASGDTVVVTINNTTGRRIAHRITNDGEVTEQADYED